MSTIFDELEAGLRAIYGGRRFLLTENVLVPLGGLARDLATRGARPSVLLAARRGTGAMPEGEAVAASICLDVPPADSVMAGIHGGLQALQALPAEVSERLEALDPNHEMRVIEPIYADGSAVAGRSVFGARWPAWQALEDKVVIDAVWDEVGVERAPCRVVPVGAAALDAAHAALDEGHGTVWAADRREGFHGGGQGTFWVRDPASRAHALEQLRQMADTARVMPFLEGLPCSIHGLVFPDHVLTTRPAELLILRRVGGVGGFLYTRSSSAWIPEPAIIEAMRDIAVRTGEYLRRTLGYRGAFTIDGVWTHGGFRPTELNPRIGAALRSVMPGMNAMLVHLALVEGHDLGVDAKALERAVRERSLTEGSASFILMMRTPLEETEQCFLAWQDGAWVEVDEEVDAEATARWGPSDSGGIAFCILHQEKLTLGPSLAPRSAAFVRWANGRLGAGFGEVEAAPWPTPRPARSPR